MGGNLSRMDVPLPAGRPLQAPTTPGVRLAAASVKNPAGTCLTHSGHAAARAARGGERVMKDEEEGYGTGQHADHTG